MDKRLLFLKGYFTAWFQIFGGAVLFIDNVDAASGLSFNVEKLMGDSIFVQQGFQILAVEPAYKPGCQNLGFAQPNNPCYV